MKVITLHKNQFQERCIQLFSSISSTPDLVVGILNGGGYILEEFKDHHKEEDIIYKTITLQRDSTKGIKKSKLTQALLRLLPYSILNRLRISEHKKRTQSDLKSLSEDLSFELNTKDKPIQSILILDDALDTGNTLNSVYNLLKSKFLQASIETAVVVWTNSESVIKPNYFVFKDILVRFHWSLDYKTGSNG
ncbi:MAG: hypothetical protein ED556_04980 [Winogradskyella sp.]|uniref:phosphoribosyltransferase family protein n=1 Tax=Winogradskyella sp. TaxID=1883156 RepID=UPI000F3F589D|nr:phosphoribosyltransferase family protein [Winogradskyella sp.]RNC86778.1 MAG: hypothetical protein ED556_04980 [Winogradskyella sp.]